MAVEVQATLLIEDASVLRVLNIDDLTLLPDDAATATLQESILSALRGGLTAPPASNAEGSESIVAGGTTDVASIMSAPENYRLHGMAIAASGDGYFKLKVNGALKLSARTRFHQPSLVVVIPRPLNIDEGDAITCEVTNECDDTAEYDAVILGEIYDNG